MFRNPKMLGWILPVDKDTFIEILPVIKASQLPFTDSGCLLSTVNHSWRNTAMIKWR